jgi:aspartyl-tRNA(Asn)/glutamyl-tRNA(Gln) amidotransferase subunit A
VNRLNQLAITEACEGLKRKQFSAKELTTACLAQIEKFDGCIKAFITVTKEEALRAASRADKLIQAGVEILRTKPLLGIPVSVKDLFCTKGVLTTAGSNILKNYIPVYDATVVGNLKDAGAIILGKTNLDAFAHGSSTEASDFFTTRNPWNINFLPGGSSGGSAASVIADEAIFSVGTETAGSIRQPASWCGIVGAKPTYGRVSRYGVIAMASSLDSPGPMTKTVEDAALVLNILAGQDFFDATTSPQLVPDYLKQLKKGVAGIKIGVAREYFSAGVDKEVAAKVKKAVGVLGSLGAKIENISLFDPQYAIAVYTILQRAEVSSNLARYDGIRFGFPRKVFGEEAKRRIMLGTYTLSAGYYDKYYLKAQKVRTVICQDFRRAFRQVDVIIGPTSPSTALPVGASKDGPMFGEIQDVLVEPSTIAGLPGLNVPCGFSAQGLPIGMQIIGPQFSEGLLFKVGYTYEEATKWHKKKPSL